MRAQGGGGWVGSTPAGCLWMTHPGCTISWSSGALIAPVRSQEREGFATTGRQVVVLAAGWLVQSWGKGHQQRCFSMLALMVYAIHIKGLIGRSEWRCSCCSCSHATYIMLSSAVLLRCCSCCRDLLDLDVIKGPAAPGAAPAGLNVTMMETL